MSRREEILASKRLRKGRAIERLAAAFAHEYSVGYPEQYDAWYDYFTGRREDAEGINLIKLDQPSRT